MIFFLSLLLILFLLLLIYPVSYCRFKELKEELPDPPTLYSYSFVIHIHTQFSMDSLGKVEDIKRAMEENQIDYALITDHDNDKVKDFLEKNMLCGIEKKLRGRGSLLYFKDFKVVAHPFLKNPWKFNRKEGFFLELIDLKDLIYINYKKILIFLPFLLIFFLFFRGKFYEIFKKFLDVRAFTKRFLESGFKTKTLGGHDHHVKFYYLDAKGKKFLFPSYSTSFKIMRNFLLTQRPEFNLKEGKVVIAFNSKTPIVWEREGKITFCSPFAKNLFLLRTKEGEEAFLGTNLTFKVKRPFVLEVYTYSFRLKNLFFNKRVNYVFAEG